MRTTGDARLSCEQFSDRLADFLEREVDEPTRAAVEAHALACADCGPLLADLRRLRIDAANLPELAPSRDLWGGIVARIETPVIELPAAGGGRPATAGGRRAWMVLAAAGLVAITAGVTHLMTKQALSRDSARTVAAMKAAPTATAPVSAAIPDTAILRRDSANQMPATAPTPMVVTSASSEGRRPSLVARPRSPIELEIARLRAIVNRRRAQLDPVTIGIVDRNLSVIDDAIAQVKEALQKDPESRFLMESLNDALENKVEILRTAAMLPSRT